MKKLLKAFLTLLVILSLFIAVPLVKAEESEYKDYYQSKSQTVNGDFEAFEVGTQLSETQLEGAWGTVSFDNPAQISEVDGSHVLDVRGGSKKYSSAFLILPDTVEVGTILRVTYDVKLELSQDKSTYEYMDVAFVGGANVEYYKNDLKQLNFEQSSSIYTTGAESVHYPVNLTVKGNGWASVVFDVVITRNDLIQTNSIRFLAILKGEQDHIYFDNVNLYYLSETPFVEEKPVESITLEDGQQLSLTVGDSKKLNYTINPEDATDKSVTWSSSDSEVVSVDDQGNISALKDGSAVISVTASNGVKAQIAIIVQQQAEEPVEPAKKGCKSSIESSLLVIIGLSGALALAYALKKRRFA